MGDGGRKESDISNLLSSLSPFSYFQIHPSGLRNGLSQFEDQETQEEEKILLSR